MVNPEKPNGAMVHSEVQVLFNGGYMTLIKVTQRAWLNERCDVVLSQIENSKTMFKKYSAEQQKLYSLREAAKYDGLEVFLTLDDYALLKEGIE